jgi:hypothetical protein
MYSTKMLIKILLSRKALAGMSFAVWVRAVDSVLGTAVLAMDFPLMSEEAAGVCKAGKVFTSFGRAAVRAFVLVHMFAENVLAWSARYSGGGGLNLLPLALAGE